MAERVRFHFDPLCPWCYQTSRWARRLVELGEIELDWGVFSLDLVNADRPADGKAHHRGGPGLRTTIAVRERAGAEGVSRFYAALGARVHQRGEPPEDAATILGALADAGLDAALYEQAMNDPTTWEAVQREHRELVERTRSFGVPTIVLDGGEGPAIFGPVIAEVPTDEDAIELFRHVSWLARYEGFAELKRDRAIAPDLASVRQFQARQGPDADLT